MQNVRCMLKVSYYIQLVSVFTSTTDNNRESAPNTTNANEGQHSRIKNILGIKGREYARGIREVVLYYCFSSQYSHEIHCNRFACYWKII